MEDNDFEEISAMDTKYSLKACGALKRKKKEDNEDEPLSKCMNLENFATVVDCNSETNTFADGSVASGAMNGTGGVALCNNYNGFEMRTEAVSSEYKSAMNDINVLDIQPFAGSSDIENTNVGLTSIPKTSYVLPKESTKKLPTPTLLSSLPAKKPLKLHRCRMCSKIFANADFLSKHFAQTHSNELSKVDKHDKQIVKDIEWGNNTVNHQLKIARHQCNRSAGEGGKSESEDLKFDIEACKSESKTGKSESEACKSESKTFKIENEACKSENKTCKPESVARKSEREARKSESEACKSGSKTCKAEREARKSESEARKSEREARKSKSEARKSESEARNIASVECKLCRMRFLDELLLKAHMPLHGDGSSKFQCNICKKLFPSITTLERHKYERNHYNSFFACHVCGQKYVNQVLLDYHLKTRHPNGFLNSLPTEYIRTDKRFSTPNAWPLPYPKSFKCSLCGIKFEKEFLMKLHIESTHGKLPTSYCSSEGLHDKNVVLKQSGKPTKFMKDQRSQVYDIKSAMKTNPVVRLVKMKSEAHKPEREAPKSESEAHKSDEAHKSKNEARKSESEAHKSKTETCKSESEAHKSESEACKSACKSESEARKSTSGACESVKMEIKQDKTDSSVLSPENKPASDAMTFECKLCGMRFLISDFYLHICQSQNLS